MATDPPIYVTPTGAKEPLLADIFWTLRGIPVPTDVWTQRDARVRCPEDPRNRLSQNQLPPSWTPATIVDQRWEYSFYEVELPPSWGLDVRHARFEREVAYTYNLAAATGNPNFFVEGVVRPSTSVLYQEHHPSNRLAVSFRRERNEIVEKQSYMPNAWRTWERNTWHKVGVFLDVINVQHREVHGLRPEIRCALYPSIFGDSSRRYEVPVRSASSGATDCYLKGVELATQMSSPLWKVLFPEHVWTNAAELAHQARRGRLFYVPPELVADNHQIGMERICFRNSSHVEELRGALREVEVIRWDRVPRRASLVPKKAST